jgi:DNA polymerase-3 subunit gamma/tau
VHRLLAEGQNLQHFCREAIGHFRNLLVARVCGADSALIAAPPDQRPRLKQTAETFSEEDLTRFFQILLHTDEDLRRKPDARLHLEMGLLRMVNAARLAPLEEILAELEGGATERPKSAASQTQARSGAQAAFAATASPSSMEGVPQTSSSARMQHAAGPRPEIVAPPAARQVVSGDTNNVSGRTSTGPVPGAPPSMIARTAEAGAGIEAAQVDAIKAAILGQEKFLGELIEHASRWEMSGNEVRLVFPTESRALAEMLQSRDPMERLRNITSRILGQTVRVCVKLEAVPGLGAATRPSAGTRELRAKFEQDPIVRAMLERFGGQISDVKQRSED